MKPKSLERLVTALAAGVILMLATMSFAADDTPQAFLERVYRIYQISDNANDIDTEAKAASYFTPAVARLIMQDEVEKAKNNDVGKLDFDPFVGGQDWAKTAITLKAAPGAKPDRATGSATFIPAGAKKPTTVKLDLEKTAAGWRIANIHWQGVKESLLQVLNGKG